VTEASCRPDRLAHVRTVMVGRSTALESAADALAPTLSGPVLDHLPGGAALAGLLDSYAQTCRREGRFVGAIGDLFAELDQQGGDQLATASDETVMARLLAEHPPPDVDERDAAGRKAAADLLDQVPLVDGTLPSDAYDQISDELRRRIQDHADDGVFTAALLRQLGPDSLTPLLWGDESDVDLARRLLSSAGFSGRVSDDFERQVAQHVEFLHLPVITDDPTHPMTDVFLRAAADRAMPALVVDGVVNPHRAVDNLGLDPDLAALDDFLSGPEDGTPYLFSGRSPDYFDTVNPNVLALLDNIAATSPAVSSQVVAGNAPQLVRLDGTLYFEDGDISDAGKSLPPEVARLFGAATGPGARVASSKDAIDAANALLGTVGGRTGPISRSLVAATADAFADNLDVVTDGVVRYSPVDGSLDQQEVDGLMQLVLRHDDPGTLSDPAGILTLATGLGARSLTTRAGGFPPTGSNPDLEKAGVLLGTYADASGDLALDLRREEIEAAGDEITKEQEDAARHDGFVGGLSYVLGTTGTVVGLVPSPWTKGAGIVLGLGSGAISQFAGSDEVNTYVDTDMSEVVAGVESSSVDGLGELRDLAVDSQLSYALEHPDAPGSGAFLDAIREYQRTSGVQVLAHDAQGQVTGLRDPATVSDPTEKAELARALADLGTADGPIYDGTHGLFGQLESGYTSVQH